MLKFAKRIEKGGKVYLPGRPVPSGFSTTAGIDEMVERGEIIEACEETKPIEQPVKIEIIEDSEPVKPVKAARKAKK